MPDNQSSIDKLKQLRAQKRASETQSLERKRETLKSNLKSSDLRHSLTQRFTVKQWIIASSLFVVIVGSYFVYDFINNALAPGILIEEYEEAIANKNFAEATTKLSKYLDLRPDDWERSTKLGELFIVQGQFSDARPLYARIIAQSPLSSDAEVQFMSALSYLPALSSLRNKLTETLAQLNTFIPALAGRALLDFDQHPEQALQDIDLALEQLNKIEAGQDTYQRYQNMMKLFLVNLCRNNSPFNKTVIPEFSVFPTNLNENQLYLYGIDANLSLDICTLMPSNINQINSFEPDLESLLHFIEAYIALNNGEIERAIQSIALSSGAEATSLNYFLDSVILVLSGDIERAQNTILRAGNQNSTAILQNLSVIQLLLGPASWEDANTSLTSFLKINSNHTPTLNNLAVIYLIQGRTGQAKSSLELALANDSLYAYAVYNLGITELLDGNIEQASKNLINVSNQIETLPGVNYYLALVNERLDDGEQAVTLYRSITTQQAYGVLANLALGDFYQRENISLETARSFYQSASSQDPNNYEAALKLALVDSKLGSIEDSLRRINNIEADYRSKENVSERYYEMLNAFKGEVLLNAGDPTAEDILATAFTNTKDIELYKRVSILYANLLLSKDKVREALDVTRTALPADPEDPELLTSRAETLLAFNDINESLLIVNDALAIDPENENALLLKARIYTKDQRWDEAILIYQQAYFIRPGDTSPLIAAVELLETIGDRDNEIREIEQQIERSNLQPEDILVTEARSQVQIVSDSKIEDVKIEIAEVTDFLAQGTVEPFSAYVYRGYLYNQIGDVLTAIKDFETATQIEGTEPDKLFQAWQNLSNAYIITAQYNKALGALDEAILNNPSDQETNALYLTRAGVKEKLGYNEEAIADYDLIIQAFPNYYQAYYRKALLYLSEDKVEEAIVDLTQALRFNPKYVEAYRARRSAYSLLGENDKAAKDAKTITLLE